jgi:NADH-quinone oxidoreductase subunit D
VHEPARVLIGSLARGVLPSVAGEPPAGTLLLHLGPDHPSEAGLIELRLWTEDGVITSAQVVVGAMHRGVEKLFEVRDYQQILMLADRHDWHAPYFGELAIALVCEQMMGLVVPDRASWLRTLLAEHTRIISHCGHLSWLTHRAGADLGLNRVREALRTQTWRLTGNRIHPMINRIGGLAADTDPEWHAAESMIMSNVRDVAEVIMSTIATDPVADLCTGVGVLRPEVSQQYGVSGPAARASGVDLDLRRQQPYLAYRELADYLTPPRDTTGDARARLALLAQEMIISAQLVEACLQRLAEIGGPVSVKLAKIIRLPEGQAYGAIEAPLGLAGAYVVSRGEKTPWRLKLRTPSFNNISCLESVLVGLRPDSVEATLASIGYVVGDVDK